MHILVPLFTSKEKTVFPVTNDWFVPLLHFVFAYIKCLKYFPLKGSIIQYGCNYCCHRNTQSSPPILCQKSGGHCNSYVGTWWCFCWWGNRQKQILLNHKAAHHVLTGGWFLATFLNFVNFASFFMIGVLFQFMLFWMNVEETDWQVVATVK